MKLITKIKLNNSQDDLECLQSMMETFNSACKHTSKLVESSGVLSNFKLHKLYYHHIKSKSKIFSSKEKNQKFL